MSSLTDRLRNVKGPRPILSREREEQLTARQREILDDLSHVFDDGFNHLTMADLAGRVNCSLRTLYGLAPSRDELVLLVVDRNLWQIGRQAMVALHPDMGPLDAIRAYLQAANVAVADSTEAFAQDCVSVASTRELRSTHSNYLIAIARELLDMAIEMGEIAPVDTAAVARVIAGLGHDFTIPEVLPTLATPPKAAADAMVDIILHGLPRP